MILEWIMHRMEWSAAWYAHPGPRGWPALGPRWHVGAWTGPDHDLVCVIRAETKEVAEAALSPPGWTALHAALRSWWKLRRLERRAVAGPAQDAAVADRVRPIEALGNREVISLPVPRVASTPVDPVERLPASEALAPAPGVVVEAAPHHVIRESSHNGLPP